MPRKNNLSALKREPRKAILPPAITVPARADSASEPTKGTNAVGRPKKKATEKRDYKITLSLTQGEGARIAEKAGLAGEATFLYDRLKRTGVFD